jgi:hypothetical protein
MHRLQLFAPLPVPVRYRAAHPHLMQHHHSAFRRCTSESRAALTVSAVTRDR